MSVEQIVPLQTHAQFGPKDETMLMSTKSDPSPLNTKQISQMIRVSLAMIKVCECVCDACDEKCTGLIYESQILKMARTKYSKM